MIDHRDVSDLSDCPFCGARPSLHPQGNDFTRSRKLTIKCTGCRIQLTHAAITHDFEWLRDHIKRDWNRRAASGDEHA
ncbi:MAG: Lar family restriction alleviation protein [Rhodanobacter sp.]